MRALLPPGLPPRTTLFPDVVAGLTAAAVVIPKAMAYATIAGIPIEVGLYTAVIPMIVYALLGTSRPLSVSTTTTIAILTGSELAASAPNGTPAELMAATTMLACLTGAALLVASLLRLGFLAKFISEPVLVGFKAGICLVIVVDQLPKFLGVKIEKGAWIHNVGQVFSHLPDTSRPALTIALVVVAVIVLLEKFLPRSPAPLLAIAAGIGTAHWMGDAAAGVSKVGNIPAGLPPLTMPAWSLAGQLAPAALGIALMSFTETVAAGRAFVARGEPRPSANRELLATGVGNLVGGFFGNMPSGGGTSQTALNRLVGAKTQMAALVTAALAVATLLFLGPAIATLPNPALAAVVIVTSLPLFKVSALREIGRFRWVEFGVAVAAAAGVVLLGTLNGILVAVVLSMVGLLHLSNNPPVYALVRKRGTDVFRPPSAEHPDDESFPGLLIIRVDGRVHFGNVEHVGDSMWPLIHGANPKVLLLDCSGIAGFEYTAFERLDAVEEMLRGMGIELWLAELTPEALAQVQKTALGKRLGRARMHFTVPRAVEAYLARGATAAPPSH
jgi:high affinity sulfate transporter 1